MHAILKGINQSYQHILEAGRQKKHGESNEEVRKQIVTKCIYETLNRHIHQVASKMMLHKEETASKQPMLLATP